MFPRNPKQFLTLWRKIRKIHRVLSYIKEDLADERVLLVTGDIIPVVVVGVLIRPYCQAVATGSIIRFTIGPVLIAP